MPKSPEIPRPRWRKRTAKAAAVGAASVLIAGCQAGPGQSYLDKHKGYCATALTDKTPQNLETARLCIQAQNGTTLLVDFSLPPSYMPTIEGYVASDVATTTGGVDHQQIEYVTASPAARKALAAVPRGADGCIDTSDSLNSPAVIAARVMDLNSANYVISLSGVKSCDVIKDKELIAGIAYTDNGKFADVFTGIFNENPALRKIAIVATAAHEDLHLSAAEGHDGAVTTNVKDPSSTFFIGLPGYNAPFDLVKYLSREDYVEYNGVGDNVMGGYNEYLGPGNVRGLPMQHDQALWPERLLGEHVALDERTVNPYLVITPQEAKKNIYGLVPLNLPTTLTAEDTGNSFTFTELAFLPIIDLTGEFSGAQVYAVDPTTDGEWTLAQLGTIALQHPGSKQIIDYMGQKIKVAKSRRGNNFIITNIPH